MFGRTRREVKNCNFYHNEQIWRDHIYQEVTAAKRWPSKWGFLDEFFLQANCKLQIPLSEDNCNSNYRLTLPSVNTVENVHQNIRKRRDRNPVHLPPVYPQTTAQMIGWTGWNHIGASALKSYNCTHRKISIEQQLQHPDTSILHRVP